MANQPPPEGIADDFLEQFFSLPSSYAAAPTGDSSSAGGGSFPLGLSLEQGSSSYGKRFRDDPDGKAERDTFPSASLFPPGLGHIQSHQIRPNPPPQVFHGQTKQGGMAAIPQSPAPRPKVRARRGQATDPHSIAERVSPRRSLNTELFARIIAFSGDQLRRERIAERIRELQDLVPNTNKTDRAVMLDEILDYVKFLRLQVKVLSMSRLGGAGAVAHLIADIPLSVEGEAGKSKQQVWEKWSTDGTEGEVAKLMEEDVGAAMQFLQSKALCMMPISLAMAIYDTHQPESQSVKPEPNTPS